jgi:glycosyltransferase involved in cell wall biosynthesis
MNILHISPDFNYACGVSKHVYLLLKYWKKEFPKDNLYFITNGGDSLERLEKINVTYKKIKLKRGSKNILLLIRNLFSLLIFCKRNKIEIIHTHHRQAELLAYIISILTKVKTITTVHSFVEGQKHLSFLSDKIIAVSNSVKCNLIEKFAVDEKKISVIYNFIEPMNIEQAVTENEVLKQLSSKKIFLFAGRISYIKSCDILIEAFGKISKITKDLHLVLIGKWELENDSNKLTENITYIKSVNSIKDYLFKSFCVILPSRLDPFPFLMLEAGLAGRPFIGGRTSGIQEFIEDGKDGLLVEPGNVDDMINKIFQIADDKNLAKKLADNLYKKVMPLTNYKKYLQNIRSIYEDK